MLKSLLPSMLRMLTLPRKSRGGNTTPFAGTGPLMGLSVATWNANLLLNMDRKARSRKRHLLSKLLRTADIKLLQEVHGDAVGLALRFPDIPRRCHVFDSPGFSSAVGGLFTCVTKRLEVSRGGLSSSAVAPGRALRVTVTDGPRSTCVWNLHNFGLTQEQVRSVADGIAVDVTRSNRDPLASTCIVAGDFNFAAASAPPLRPDAVVDDPPLLPYSERLGQKPVEHALKTMTEFVPFGAHPLRRQDELAQRY